MAIDYQRILMDMNRPRNSGYRSQEKSMKKFFLAVVIMAVVFGGTFAAWQYGIVRRAWQGANRLAASVTGGDAAAIAEALPSAPPQQTRGAMLSAMAAPAPAAAPAEPTVAPQAKVVLPAPAKAVAPVAPRNDTAPIDIASQSSRAPKSAPVQPQPRTAAEASPVQTRPSPQQQLQAQAMAKSLQPAQAQPAQQSAAVAVSQTTTTPSATASAAPAAATPVLSDAKAQIRAIDQMLASNPSEAMRRLDALVSSGLEPDDAAEAGYRRGYAARMLRDEATAESAWRGTADAFPALRGGRFSALALGDTWFQRYAGDRPQLSYWDDISVMYSRALGRDDAPFLPGQVKAELKRKLGIVNEQVLFGGAPGKLAQYHTVESGELLGSIANKYRVDYESIARVNGINPNRISVGMDLKVVVGDVDVVVRKYAADPNRTPTVTWFIDGRWAREYPACVGDGVKTPAGSYTFTLKERDPSWTNPLNGQLLPNDHPENILGSRWMAMKGMNTQGLGIHGTTVDDSVPGYTSAGCVRLHNKDVEELFSFARVGGKVTIIE